MTSDAIDSEQERSLKQSIDVVKFSECLDHFYHKECADQLLGKKEHIKCCVCNKVYGIEMGD